MTAMRRLLIVVVCLVILCGCGAERTPVMEYPVEMLPTSTPVPTWLTLDGKESGGTLAATEIVLWKDRHNRDAGIAGVGRHGQTVKQIRRAPDAVLVELKDGTRGWVTYYFIKEYK